MYLIHTSKAVPGTGENREVDKSIAYRKIYLKLILLTIAHNGTHFLHLVGVQKIEDPTRALPTSGIELTWHQQHYEIAQPLE